MFDKRIIRRIFNMVEVMLAVIVVALGIASTFVLFPVGLNASKDAVAESRVADISETAALIVQSEVIPNLVETASNKGFSFKAIGNSNEHFCERPTASDNTEIDKTVDPESLEDSKKVSGTDLYKMGNGLYVYVSKVPDSGEVLFAAAVKVYLDRDSSSDNGFENEYFCTRDGIKKYSAIKGSVNDCINKFLLPVAVEVSWPVTVPAADREKRVFRFELFNSEYDPGTDADAQKS
jgi:hypothetical protein